MLRLPVAHPHTSLGCVARSIEFEGKKEKNNFLEFLPQFRLLEVFCVAFIMIDSLDYAPDNHETCTTWVDELI